MFFLLSSSFGAFVPNLFRFSRRALALGGVGYFPLLMAPSLPQLVALAFSHDFCPSVFSPFSNTVPSKTKHTIVP